MPTKPALLAAASPLAILLALRWWHDGVALAAAKAMQRALAPSENI